MTAPKISIITVVLNRAHDIRYTLESISNQSYTNIEFIVIDGNSTDGTLKIIEEFKHKISQLIVGKDAGIYDAMNKGLKIASGDYVLFINGGDALHTNDVVEKMAAISMNNAFPDIIYGECMFVEKNRNQVGTRSETRNNKLPENLNYQSFRYGSNVTHQCFVVKKSLTSDYELRFKLSSDIDWMLNCIKKSKANFKANFIIADFVLGDASQENAIQSWKERIQIFIKHYGVIITLFSQLYVLTIRPLHSRLKKIKFLSVK